MGAELSIRIDSSGPVRIKQRDLPTNKATAVEVGAAQNGAKVVAWTSDGGILIHNPDPTRWENGRPAFISDLEGEGVAPWALASVNGNTWQLPDSAIMRPHVAIPGSDASPYLLGGEVWGFYPSSILSVDEDRLRFVCDALITERMNRDVYDAPRIRHLLNLFRDRWASEKPDKGKLRQGADRDEGWRLRHWEYRYGAANGPRTSAFHLMAEQWGSGFSAWHYNSTLWYLLAQHEKILLEGGEVEPFGLIQAYLEATWGHVRSGRWAGMRHYEKGHEHIGAQQEPTWGKQFPHGLAAWAVVTGSQTMADLLYELGETALNKPATWWGGEWGAREFGNWLETLECLYGITKDSRYADKAAQAIAHVFTLIDPISGVWANKGNGGSAPTSPWMQAQLVEKIMRWIWFHRVAVQFTPQLLEVARAVVRGGMDRFHGEPRTFYRMLPSIDSSGHPLTHNADMARMVLLLRHADPGRYSGLYDDLIDIIRTYAGSSWSDIANQTPDNLSLIGAEYAEQGGGGWPKAMRITLNSMIL